MVSPTLVHDLDYRTEINTFVMNALNYIMKKKWLNLD